MEHRWVGLGPRVYVPGFGPSNFFLNLNQVSHRRVFKEGEEGKLNTDFVVGTRLGSLNAGVESRVITSTPIARPINATTIATLSFMRGIHRCCRLVFAFRSRTGGFTTNSVCTGSSSVTSNATRRVPGGTARTNEIISPDVVLCPHHTRPSSSRRPTAIRCSGFRTTRRTYAT